MRISVKEKNRAKATQAHICPSFRKLMASEAAELVSFLKDKRPEVARLALDHVSLSHFLALTHTYTLLSLLYDYFILL